MGYPSKQPSMGTHYFVALPVPVKKLLLAQTKSEVSCNDRTGKLELCIGLGCLNIAVRPYVSS